MKIVVAGFALFLVYAIYTSNYIYTAFLDVGSYVNADFGSRKACWEAIKKHYGSEERMKNTQAEWMCGFRCIEGKGGLGSEYCDRIYTKQELLKEFGS